MKYDPRHAVARAVKSLSVRGRIAAGFAVVALIGGGTAGATGAEAGGERRSQRLRTKKAS